MTNPEPTCLLCEKTQSEHRRLEELKVLNHRFTEIGKLEEIDRSPKTKTDQPKVREVLVVPSADLLVRSLLIAKGVLSESDFEAAGAFGTGSNQDLSNRTEETPE